MKQIVIYGIVAVVVVLVISYLYATRANEMYIDQPFNLIVVDANGNMSAVAVRPPYLNGVPPNSNVVYTDALGNLGVMTVGDIYTSYQGNASTKIRNLLTIDGNNNLSTLPTHNFSPCHINGDPNTNPNATINGTPQRDGTCACRNKWSGTAKGDGCAVCDGYGVTHTDGSFGALAGPDCQYSRPANCSSRGNVNGSGGCKCDPTYAGSVCQFSDAVNCSGHGSVTDSGSCSRCDATYAGSKCQYSDGANCNGRGYVDANGNCPTCYTYQSGSDGVTKPYLGERCQFGDNVTCGNNGSIAQSDGSCKWLIKNGDNIRISSNGEYLKSIENAGYCGRGWSENVGWAQGLAFTGGYDESRCKFVWKDGIFYYKDKPVLPQYGVNTSCATHSIAGNSWGNGVLTNAPIGRPSSLAIQKYGLSGSKDNWKLSLVNPAPHLSDNKVRYLGKETAEERFCDGWTHATAWAQKGGGHGWPHTMAGFGNDAGSGLPLKIEKMGTDGQWYSIDGIL